MIFVSFLNGFKSGLYNKTVMGTAGIALGVIRLTYGYKTKGNLKY